MIWDVHPRSIRIRIFPHPGFGSRIQRSNRHRIPDPQHWFLVLFFVSFTVIIPHLSMFHFSRATNNYSIMSF